MFDFNVKIFGNMAISVIAENKQEAERILNDTIESITIKDIKEKDSRNNDVNIRRSFVTTKVKENEKDRCDDR